ncbi:sugar diacid recognition domain-containing protein [Sporosarcina sp.]|uniref:CdaR family transcriptional regulator n=1 Tax=Sporosarcina sp. TaxID=49982 RepID=UPI00262026E6|nr:sugar diacid recognition domain-containing protein [Sporosarcina sp.]
MFQFDKLGQEMVKEISNLIQQQVILTDRRGFIQASTEEDRINQFHEGALLSIRQKEVLYMGNEEVERLQGVRKGIVLPIIIDGEPIAALGITGEPEKIRPQAQLILRVAELFIQDSMKRKQKAEKVRDLEFFVFDWLTGMRKDERFVERGTLLGIDVTQYRQVAVIEVMDLLEQFSIEEVDIFTSIQNIHSSMKMIRWAENKIVLLLPEMNQETLAHELKFLLLHMKRRKKVKVVAGIGAPTDYFDLAKSYGQAEQAVSASKRSGEIVFEHELRLEVILQSIPEAVRADFLSRTVAPLIKEEELMNNLKVWFSENQSMQNTAQRLHIHKNTLSYRLQKIEQLTGLSVSSTHDVFLLYLALSLLEEQTNK